MHAGLESFLAKVQTIRDSFTPYRMTNTRDLFQPYSPAPEKIKALTDKTKALYEDLLRMKRNIVMEQIKLRERKLLALVDHELKHYFGKPYENNYYTGMTQVSFIHSLIHLSIRPSVRPYIHISIYLSIHPSVHQSVRPYVCSSVRPSVRPSVHSSIHPSIHPSIYLSNHLSVRPSICSSVLPPVRPPLTLSFLPSVRPSIYPSIGMFVCPSFPLSVCPFLRLLIHSRILYTFVRLSVPYSLRFSVHPFSDTSVHVLLNGRAAWNICFSQSEVLPRSELIGNRYGLSALVSQSSFRGETSRGVAKSRMFSQACSFLSPSLFFFFIYYTKT